MRDKLIIKYKKLIWVLLIFMLGIISWIISIINQKYISDYHGAVSIRYKEPVLTRQNVEAIIKDMVSKNEYNIPQVTLWQRYENITIYNEDRNSASTALITVAGDMTKVYPESMVYGGYLSKEDFKGCVIDRETAYKLFGSENVVGLTVKLNDKEYVIRGIIQKPGGSTMIIQEEESAFSEDKGIKYSCMELEFTDTENAKYLAEKFITTYGLGEPLIYNDGYMYQKLSYFIIHIPLWGAAGLIVIYCARRVKKLSASPVLFVAGWVGVVILSIILFKIINVNLYYPKSLIPNSWSDFDFWVSKWKSFISKLNGIEGSILLYKDVLLKKRMLLVTIGSLMTILLLKVSGTMYRKKGA